MPVEKLKTVDAFIVFDWASDLARSMTYAFATFEMRRSGASAGINALDEDRADAVAKFAAEIAPMVASGRFLPEPGTRVPRAGLEPLTEADPRAAAGEVADYAAVAGVVAAAAQAAGGLDDRTVAIEGFTESGPVLAAATVEQGAKVVAVTSGAKGAVDRGGFPADALSTPGKIPEADQTATEALAQPVDVLFTGSKMGAITHTVAEQLSANTVVPHSPIPVTARALAVLGRAGTTVVPDFISTAGALFAWWPTDGHTPEAIAATAAAQVTASLEEIATHPDGLFLAAAQRAEAFLFTWRDSLPFGRPLAS